ncbi:hypothetical protein TNCT_261991 [Trichonephila clavata]|uniref:Uncharacterized protein n=1 Tax=Trichonephila clavata TaxID=2740835 RepID=A0A8X6KGH9_TRICU|nr:hypothetical protein TNCT_261991 [Trichonephila clavata]
MGLCSGTGYITSTNVALSPSVPHLATRGNPWLSKDPSPFPSTSELLDYAPVFQHSLLLNGGFFADEEAL